MNIKRTHDTARHGTRSHITHTHIHTHTASSNNKRHEHGKKGESRGDGVRCAESERRIGITWTPEWMKGKRSSFVPLVPLCIYVYHVRVYEILKCTPGVVCRAMVADAAAAPSTPTTKNTEPCVQHIPLIIVIIAMR